MRIPLAVVVPAAGCDCAHCDLYLDNPDAGQPLCSGCNTSCDYCGCARAGARAARPCGQCPIRCGSRPDIRAWMADAGGTLAFDDLVVDVALPAGLPRFVPQVDGHDVAAFDQQLRWPAYGVGLRRVFSPDTHRVYPKFAGVAAHDALTLAAGQLAVLVGYGEDPLVEAFWTDRRALIAELADQHWDLVLAPNFSMYGNQPRAEQLLNFRRNLQVAAEMADAGMAAVPNIYWYRLEDLDRYLAWLDDTHPAAIAMNLQTFRTADDWDDMAVPGLTYLAMSMPADIKVIVTGSSRAERIAVLVDLFGARLHLVSQNPQAYARHGAQMTPAGRVDVHADTRDLFAANVRYYDNLMRGEP